MDCNCKKFKEELVFRFLDDELGQDVQVVHRHVEDCPHCARQVRYTRRLLMIVRERAGRAQAPERLLDRILAGLPHRRSRFLQ